MSDTFITNSGDRTLLQRLSQLAMHSDRLSFLSGFFYFSGNQALAEALKKNPNVVLRVLVGLQADEINGGIAEFSQRPISGSREQELRSYLNSLKSTLKHVSFDEPSFYEQAQFFLDMLDSGRLEIRKTEEPNHAKLYLFELNDSQIGKNRLFVTGSSNLTRFGLSEQNEFNVEISDYGFDQALDYFDECWDNAIPLTESAEEKQEIREVLKNESPLRQLSPAEAYLAAIDAYLDSIGYFESPPRGVEAKIENAGYKPLKYQVDAVKQALSIFNKFGGVVIADVVGLGKSVIGSALASVIGKRGLLLAPPGLIGDDKRSSGWKKYLEDFGLHDWIAVSTGALEIADDLSERFRDIEVVMIDEAHKFRNENTKSYEALLKICRGKKVILLTATPFNNSPSDLLSLLQLFLDPKNSGLVLDRNVKATFENYRSEFDKLAFIKKNIGSRDPDKKKKAMKLADELFDGAFESTSQIDKRSGQLGRRIKATISPVLIRRNRLDILNNPEYAAQISDMPTVRDPMEWFFELTNDQSNFYDYVIQKVFADPANGGEFEGAIYQPQRYEKILDGNNPLDNFAQIQQNLYDFMRRLLVKRFESSFGAFRESLSNFKSAFETALNFVEAQKIFFINRDLMSKLEDADDEEAALELEGYISRLSEASDNARDKVYDFSDDVRREVFTTAIKKDISTFTRLLQRMEELDMIDNDPKVATLVSRISEVRRTDPERKVVIFSEYRDTIRYFQSALESNFPGRVLSVTGDLTSSTLTQIQLNFDASFKNFDDFDILLGTDKLSEGFNLSRAGLVINLDIPWNPVRVIQRIGRINRIGARIFRELHVVNFFPSTIGASLVKSREIAAEKMFLIHSALGEDSKVFDSQEVPGPSSLYQKLNANPDSLEEEGFLTKVLKIRRRLMEGLNLDLDSKFEVPRRIKVGKISDEVNLSVLVRGETLHTAFLVDDPAGEPRISELTFEELIEHIEADETTPSANWNTEWFWTNYKMLLHHLMHRQAIASSSSGSNESKVLHKIESFIQKNVENPAIQSDLRVIRKQVISSGRISAFTLKQMANSQLANELIECARTAGVLNYEQENMGFVEPEVVLAIGNMRENEH